MTLLIEEILRPMVRDRSKNAFGQSIDLMRPGTERKTHGLRPGSSYAVTLRVVMKHAADFGPLSTHMIHHRIQHEGLDNFAMTIQLDWGTIPCS